MPRIILTFGYWAIVTVTFFFNWTWCILAVLPWSYFAIGAQMPLAAGHPFERFLNGFPGSFLSFPLLCGGLNTAIIYGLVSLLNRKKPSKEIVNRVCA